MRNRGGAFPEVVCAGLVALAAGGCFGQTGASSPTAPVTFEQISSLIYNNCTSCHRTGQIAPIPLMSYSDVVRHSVSLAAVVADHTMPPWKPAPGWSSYLGQRSLTDQQIAMIQQWVYSGAPQGDPAKEAPMPSFTDGWQLGTPDLILEMPAGFSIPAEGDDIYRNFVIHTNLTEDKWVKAIELKPSAPTVVHHSLFYSDTTGNAAKLDGQDGQPGFPGFGSIFTFQGASISNILNGGLGGWTPGTVPQYLPDGIAMPLPKGSDFLLQTHFHLNGIAQTEKSQIGLYFGAAPTRTMTQIQTPAFFGIRANIDIPAGMNSYKVRGTFTLPVDVDAVLVSAHMHYLGREAKLTATLPTGEVKILLWVPAWDFRWQGFYTFQNLVPLPKGTRLDGELTYDNSSANPSNPHSPPQEIQWGEQSTDEMGSLLLNVVPHQESDIATLQNSTLNFILTPTPQVGNKPLFVSSGMLDGASLQAGTVTPGKIVVLYGDRLGPAAFDNGQLGPDGNYSSTLGGTQVLFDGQPAPLLFATSGLITAVAPYELDGKTGTQVQVRNGSLTSDPVALPVTPAAPSIFSVSYTGSGQGAIINQDGVTPNSSQHPAPGGSIVSIFATGEGQTTPGGVDGKINNAAPFPKPSQPVTVLVNGTQAEVLYAGAAPGQVAGLMQVNVRVPAGTPPGDIPVEIHVGNTKSQPGITVAVQ